MGRLWKRGGRRVPSEDASGALLEQGSSQSFPEILSGILNFLPLRQQVSMFVFGLITILLYQNFQLADG